MENIYGYDEQFSKRMAQFHEETEGDCTAPAREKHLAIMACLIACGSANMFEKHIPRAISEGVTAEEVRELLYQASAYVGESRAYDFFAAAGRVLGPAQVQPFNPDKAERLKAGEQAQTDIFGEGMRGFANAGEGADKIIHSRLVSNCFGDYYTRGAIDYRVRELITVCILLTLGDVKPQLTSHIKAAVANGNSKDYLKQIVLLLQPYNGYPRTLNALSAIESA